MSLTYFLCFLSCLNVSFSLKVSSLPPSSFQNLLLLRGLEAEAQAALAVLILQEIETYSGLMVYPLAYSLYSKHILIQSLWQGVPKPVLVLYICKFFSLRSPHPHWCATMHFYVSGYARMQQVCMSSYTAVMVAASPGQSWGTGFNLSAVCWMNEQIWM